MGWFEESWEATRTVGQALKVTWKNLWRQPVTISYPDEKRELAPRQRATFALLIDQNGNEKCTGCKICENICPAAVITMIKEQVNNRGFAREFTLDLGGCIFCELCVQACPQDAIVMLRMWENAQFDRQTLILNKQTLLSNQKYQPSVMSGVQLREMQAAPKTQAASGVKDKKG